MLGRAFKIRADKLPAHMVEEITKHILEHNENITLKQIKEGIGYGWYYIDDKDIQPHYEINEYNRHLWEDVDKVVCYE